MKKRELYMSLCEGRHEIAQAVDGAVFKRDLTFDNIGYLESEALGSIWCAAFTHYRNGDNGYLACDPDGKAGTEYNLYLCHDLLLNLYVTGFTPALIAVLNMCRVEGLSVRCWHYDRDIDDYIPQDVVI